MKRIQYHGVLYRAVKADLKESTKGLRLWSDLHKFVDMDTALSTLTESADHVFSLDEGTETPFENFENGYNLGVSANGKQAVYMEIGGAVLIFLDENKLLKLLQSLKPKAKRK